MCVDGSVGPHGKSPPAHPYLHPRGRMRAGARRPASVKLRTGPHVAEFATWRKLERESEISLCDNIRIVHSLIDYPGPTH
jgi:hypothetical protein